MVDSTKREEGKVGWRGESKQQEKERARERWAAFSGIVILFLLFSKNAAHKHLRLFQYKT